MSHLQSSYENLIQLSLQACQMVTSLKSATHTEIYNSWELSNGAKRVVVGGRDALVDLKLTNQTRKIPEIPEISDSIFGPSFHPYPIF